MQGINIAIREYLYQWSNINIIIIALCYSVSLCKYLFYVLNFSLNYLKGLIDDWIAIDLTIYIDLYELVQVIIQFKSIFQLHKHILT